MRYGARRYFVYESCNLPLSLLLFRLPAQKAEANSVRYLGAMPHHGDAEFKGVKYGVT